VSTIRLFADDCVIYKKLLIMRTLKKLQKNLERLGDMTAENEMK
jgi:hypothetical protein